MSSRADRTLPIEDLINEYLDYLSLVRRLSTRSVAAYRRDLGLYADFSMSGRFRCRRIGGTPGAFLASLGRRGLSSRSIIES